MKKERMKMIKIQGKDDSYFKFPLTLNLTRSYSTIDSSLIQLLEDIDFIYNDLRTSFDFKMSQKELSGLKQVLLSGFYTPSPIRLRRIRRDALVEFLTATLPDFPDLSYGPSKKSDEIYVVFHPSKKEDVLVFMALSILFYRFTYGSVPKENYRILDRVGIFYSGIQKMGKVTRLHQINIDPYFEILLPSEVLAAVEPFVGADSVCYNLVSKFVNLDAFDEYGKRLSFDCIPTVGEITRVLFNLTLIEFDRQLRDKYPGIKFERLLGNVFIASTDDLIFDEYQGWYIIEDLGLTCEIQSIGPGDEPIECRHRMVALDCEGNVVVYYPIEYDS